MMFKINKTMPQINRFIRWFGFNFSTHNEEKQTHYVIRYNGFKDTIVDVYYHIKNRVKLGVWDW